MDIQISCNCKLFSELIDPSINTQMSHNWKLLSELTDFLIDAQSSDDNLLTRWLLMHVSRAVQGCLSEQHLPFILSSNILLYYNFFLSSHCYDNGFTIFFPTSNNCQSYLILPKFILFSWVVLEILLKCNCTQKYWYFQKHFTPLSLFLSPPPPPIANHYPMSKLLGVLSCQLFLVSPPLLKYETLF